MVSIILVAAPMLFLLFVGITVFHQIKQDERIKVLEFRVRELEFKVRKLERAGE